MVAVTGVRNGGQYLYRRVPAAGCATTDSVSGVDRPATIKVTTTGSHGVGSFTATCSGATSVAGTTQAAPVSVRYSVAYGLGGFTSPRPGSQVAKSARKIRVRFRLTDAAGHPLTSWISRWLASTHRVRATLSGRGIRRVTAGCGWNSWARSFNCVIRIPAAARTGWRHRYFITAYENTGAGFVRARAVGRAVNPETIHFK